MSFAPEYEIKRGKTGEREREIEREEKSARYIPYERRMP
jgi:hypothetical protein